MTDTSADMPEIRHDLRITDTTLRDGSHAMAHQFTEEQVRATVHALDRSNVEVIEVTHGDGLGGSSFNYGFSHTDEIRLIEAAVEEATQAAIAVLLVPGIGTMDDLQKAHGAGARVARMATHCTEADVSVQHFGLARSLGMETVGFLMMAQIAGIDFEDLESSIPAFVTLLTIPLTYSISHGIGYGFITFVVIKLVGGKPKDVHPLMYATAAAFGAYFLFAPHA